MKYFVLSFVLGDFMKNKRKICAALMLISFMSHCVTAADDEIFTGSCTEAGCVWTLNKTSGRIVFENPDTFNIGTLVMDDALKEFVEEGVIANGTKNVLYYPFDRLPNLKNVSIPETVTYFQAFIRGCPQVEELTFNGDIKFGTSCQNCVGLKAIHLGPSVRIGRNSALIPGVRI